ncbi:hypothetical protein BsWGS_10268 [Bradybaena similaris]
MDTFAEVITSLGIPPVTYLVVLLALTLLVTSWMRKSSSLPPCPVWPFPIIGHIPYLITKPRETLRGFRKKTGDIYTLYLGSKPTVVLNGYDLLKDTLVKQADIFTDRPDFLVNSSDENGKTGVVGASGHSWKEQRTVTLAILRTFGVGKNSLAEKIQEEVSAYVDKLATFKGRPQEVRTLTNIAVSNVICSIIVGKRFQYDDSYFIDLMHMLNEQVRLTATVSISSSFPWLRYLPGDMFKLKKIVQNIEKVKNHFCDPFIQLFSKKLEEGEGDDDSSASFITSYLKELKRKEAAGEATTMKVIELVRVIMDLFIAGTETISTTMMWFVIYMLHYPDVQKKVFNEINEVVGTERVVSLQDKPQLNYLNATIMETQRLASIVPFNLLHTNNAEVKVRGYTIPVGTNIMPNLDSVLHDEKIWGDPLNFRPSRFLDSEGKLLHPEEFVPFSLGRRVCLGESLSKMELFLFLSALVQRFQFLPATPTVLPNLNYLFGITCAPEAFEIRFVERRNV